MIRYNLYNRLTRANYLRGDIMAKKDTNNKQKVYHAKPFERDPRKEKPISNVYSAIDNDLARDNFENDIPDADLQDL